MVDYEKGLEPDGVFFYGERENYLEKGYTEEQINNIRSARQQIRGIMSDCEASGKTSFVMSFEDVAIGFPKREDE